MPAHLAAAVGRLCAVALGGAHAFAPDGRGSPGRPASFLQSRAALAPEIDGACRCLDWKQVYGKMGVACGQGLELYSQLGSNLTGLAAADERLVHSRDEVGSE